MFSLSKHGRGYAEVTKSRLQDQIYLSSCRGVKYKILQRNEEKNPLIFTLLHEADELQVNNWL